VLDGEIVVPSGLRYRVLVLPDHKVLSLAALEKVAELLERGATVVGPKPDRLVSLVGGEEAQERFHELASGLWGETPGPEGTKKIGSGRLVWGLNSRELLQRDGVPFDFEALDVKSQSDFETIHYTVEGGDVYFVSNQTDQPQKARFAFRAAGRQPELWDPVTGEISKAGAFEQTDSRTILPIEFDPYGASLVFFRQPIPTSQQGSDGSNFPTLQTVEEIDGPWQVAFDPAWGGPASIEFETLTDWTQRPEEGIRYYSGSATYTKRFTLHVEKDKRYWLQLNEVKDVGIASIDLNGKEVGTAWTKPFRVELTDAAAAGENELEIAVVNSWQNRLIGDRGKDPSERFTQTNIRIKDEWNLRPSGLLGPVEIKSD
ncbi:MAG: glycoside hydrolase, partial [Candidatus Omnitrophica bacterium]|nr:glycoside hydrolase [Candidatus Omnitrophota bacterium]